MTIQIGPARPTVPPFRPDASAAENLAAAESYLTTLRACPDACGEELAEGEAIAASYRSEVARLCLCAACEVRVPRAEVGFFDRADGLHECRSCWGEDDDAAPVVAADAS